MKRLRAIEAFLWASGLGLLAAFAAERVRSDFASHQGIVALHDARARHLAHLRAAPVSIPGSASVSNSLSTPVHAPTGSASARVPMHAFEPDMQSWSNTRRAAYQSGSEPVSMPNAVLRIPSIGLEVPIYYGTSSGVLNRGAGLIEGTALPGEAGNMAIAAHRDGFFRPLQDIQTGAAVYVDTIQGTHAYRVTGLSVVTPQEVGVLAHTARRTVTLVTCYPFHFVGPAPKRFIVRAEDVDQPEDADTTLSAATR